MYFLSNYQASLQNEKYSVVKYYFTFLCFLLCAFSCSFVEASPGYDAQVISGEALKVWHKKRVRETIREKERHILRTSAAFGGNHPNLVKEYLFLVILCIMNRNYEQASSFIEKGLKVARKSSPKGVKDFYELQALIHYQLGKYEKARNYFKQAFENSNSQASWEEPQAILSILCYIMRCAYQLGDSEQVIVYGEMLASQAATSGLQQTAEVAEAYEMLARAYYRHRNNFHAFWYINASMSIQKELNFATPSQVLRTKYLAFQVHETIRAFPVALSLLGDIYKILNTTHELSTSHHTSYLEEKYSFSTSFKPLDRLLPRVKAEDVQREIQRLQEYSTHPKEDLIFPPNAIPDPFLLTYPKRGLFWPGLMIMLSYGSWIGWIYSLAALLIATQPQQRQVSGIALLILTLTFPLSLYLLYRAHAMIALSGIKVGFMQDTLILDESIETTQGGWLSNFFRKSLLWFMHLESIVVIPYHRIEKIEWYSGGRMYTDHASTATHSQTGLRSELGEEYETTSTQKAIVNNEEKYTIIKKKRRITKLEDTASNNTTNENTAANANRDAPVKYKAVETVNTSVTSFAEANKLVIYAFWQGKPRVYVIDSQHGTYGTRILDFFKILVKKHIPFTFIVEDNSDLLARKKKYLEEFFANEN